MVALVRHWPFKAETRELKWVRKTGAVLERRGGCSQPEQGCHAILMIDTYQHGAKSDQRLFETNFKNLQNRVRVPSCTMNLKTRRSGLILNLHHHRQQECKVILSKMSHFIATIILKWGLFYSVLPFCSCANWWISHIVISCTSVTLTWMVNGSSCLLFTGVNWNSRSALLRQQLSRRLWWFYVSWGSIVVLEGSFL